MDRIHNTGGSKETYALESRTTSGYLNDYKDPESYHGYCSSCSGNRERGEKYCRRSARRPDETTMSSTRPRKVAEGPEKPTPAVPSEASREGKLSISDLFKLMQMERQADREAAKVEREEQRLEQHRRETAAAAEYEDRRHAEEVRRTARQTGRRGATRLQLRFPRWVS